MDLRPAEIAMRQFPRTLFGADPVEVRRFLTEAAASLDRVNVELARVISDRTALQTTLKQMIAEVEALRTQLAEAHEKLAPHQEQESLIARAFLNAQKVTEDLTKESIAQAARTIAEANATAQEIIQSARNSAADLLRTTRARAQDAVEAADRAAAARIAEGQIEAEHVMEEARRTVGEVQQAAQQQLERFIARLEAFLVTREDMSKHLDGLAKRHADSLEVIGRMHAEVEQTILPSLRDFMRTLTETQDSLAGQPVSPVVTDAPSLAGVLAAPSRPTPPAPPPRLELPAHLATDGRETQPPTPPLMGEIVVSPIHSYLQATKLVTAVSRIRGVRTARLRTYSRGSVIIEVMAEAGTVAGVEPHLISGFPMEVVEATDRRVVLRIISNGGARPSS
jgi:cell division septum initiation protein DivIVA